MLLSPPPEIAQTCSYPPPGVGTENSISRAAFLNFLLPNLCMGRVLRDLVPDTLKPWVHSTSAELWIKNFQSAPVPQLLPNSQVVILEGKVCQQVRPTRVAMALLVICPLSRSALFVTHFFSTAQSLYKFGSSTLQNLCFWLDNTLGNSSKKYHL